MKIKSTGCCKPFSPSLWEDKEIKWTNKLFVKDHVVSFLRIPLNYGNIVTRNLDLIEKANAKTFDQLMLTDEKSLWGADIYFAVSKNVTGAQMKNLTGIFLTKVFEGPFQNVGKWIEEMKIFVENKDKKIKKLYFFYTTCPKCAKVYGKNYVVLFAQIN